MQTKGLYKALLGKEIVPEEIAPLAEDASNEQMAERKAKKVQQRNKQIEEINERNNTVWCHIALALDNKSFIHDMIACHQMVLGTERKRGGYYNRDFPTSRSQLS